MPKNKKKTNKVSSYQENKYLNYSLLFLFLIFLSFFSTFKITGDDDVFWHLATGRYIVNNLTVPSTDIFGYMTEGQQWMPFEWGWDVITYGIYTFSGYIGLSVFRTILLTALFLILFYILRRFQVSYTLAVLSLLILLFAIIDRLTPRPHLISYLFFSLELLIIISFRYFNRNNFKVLYFIPLIFIIWANMHMGIIAGLFLIILFLFSEVLIYYKPSFSNREVPPLNQNQLFKLFLLIALSVIFMFVNPNFIQTYIYAYEHTKMKMLETVNEWVSPFSSKYSDSFVSYLYKIFLFLGILVLYYSYRKKDVFIALVSLGFGLYSVRAMRFTVDYVIINFVFIVVSISFLISNLKSENFKIFINSKSQLKYIIIAVLIFFIYSLHGNKLYLEYLRYYRVSGFGINSDFIPVQMFDFMKKNDITSIGERIFNHFGTGGFFIWNFPERKNFIDSRNLNDDIFFKYNQILTKRPGFEQKINEYGVDYAIYLAPDLVRDPKEMEQTVISYFCKSPDWKLLFWDDKSFLWVRNLPKFQDLINKYEYKYITPYNFVYQKNLIDKSFSENKEIAIDELNRAKTENPNGLFINSILNTYKNKISPQN